MLYSIMKRSLLFFSIIIFGYGIIQQDYYLMLKGVLYIVFSTMLLLRNGTQDKKKKIDIKAIVLMLSVIFLFLCDVMYYAFH